MLEPDFDPEPAAVRIYPLPLRFAVQGAPRLAEGLNVRPGKLALQAFPILAEFGVK